MTKVKEALYDIHAIDDTEYQMATAWYEHYHGDRPIFQDTDGRLYVFSDWSDFDKDDVQVNRFYFDEYGDYSPAFDEVLSIYAK